MNSYTGYNGIEAK